MPKKNKYKIPGEIVTIETVKTPHGGVKVPVSTEKPKLSGKEAAKKAIKKYDKIRREKTFKKMFRGESIIEAAKKIFGFEEFKKQ